jgi:hypothetical protein
MPSIIVSPHLRQQGCSTRTLYRLLRNYDATRQLPLVFVDVMRNAGFDPALGQNRKVVKSLSRVATPASHADAKVSLHLARANVVRMAPTVKSAPNTLEEFATRIVRMFETRYRSYHGADRDEQIRFILERIVNVLGANVQELRTYRRSDRVPEPAKGSR